VAFKLDAGRGDRLDRDQHCGKPALHVVGAEPKNPAVAIDRLGLKALAGEMLLLPGVRRVHVSGEQEIEPMPATAPMPDRVGPAGTSGRSASMPARRMRATRYCATPISLPVGLPMSTKSMSSARRFSLLT